MTAKLEGSIKRFIGKSHDTKPSTGNYWDGQQIEIIPHGSSFLETDTGRIYRYNDNEWTYVQPEDNTEFLLTAILLELQELNLRHALDAA